MIAYLRDFGMNYHFIAESFETSVPWSNVLLVCERVKKRVHAERESWREIEREMEREREKSVLLICERVKKRVHAEREEER